MDRLGKNLGIAADLSAAPLRHFAGSIVLVVLGLVGIGTGAAISWSEDSPAALAIIGGIGLVVGGIGVALLRRRKSGWKRLEVYERGFGLFRDREEKEVLYEEMHSLAIREEQLLNHGVREGLLRRVEARGLFGKVVFADCALDAKPPVTAAALEAVVEGAAAEADKRVGGGGELRGRGWTLRSDGLHVGGAPAVGLLLVDHVGMFDGRASLWREGQDLPFFGVADHSPNARVLLAVASKHMRPSESGAAHGLGRVLFQKGHSRVGAAVAAVFAVSALVPAVAGFFIAGENAMAVGLGFLMGAVPLGLLALWLFRHRLLCHERGVVLRGLTGTRALRYDEVERFAYTATRMYYNGAYIGTNLQLVFRPAQGRAVKFGSRVQGGDADLDLLRDHVSAVVARRLRERLAAEPEVKWGKNAALTREGVSFHPTGLFGLRRGPLTTLRYADDLRFEINQGSFSLRAPSGPVLSMSCGEDNFYPGFNLLTLLSREAAEKKA
jgi:hypothetical protein